MKAEKSKNKRKFSLGGLTTLFVVVVFGFVVLLVSIAAAIAVLFILYKIGIMPDISDSSVSAFLAFLLLVSLSIGTAIIGISGTIAVRPLQNLIAGTKEITNGNYNVHITPTGTSEFQKLAVAFNEMAQELKSVETLRSDFVNNISHEFKTPIVSILGFAKMLKKKTLPEEKRDKYLDHHF